MYLNYYEKAGQIFHCGNKIQYTLKELADKKAPDGQTSYQCRFCGYFHTGHLGRHREARKAQAVREASNRRTGQSFIG